MSIGHRPDSDPDSVSGARVRQQPANARLERHVRMVREPWGRFLLRIVLSVVSILAAASLVFWLASL